MKKLPIERKVKKMIFVCKLEAELEAAQEARIKKLEKRISGRDKS